MAGHLDESIQARLELGEPPEVAEINAVTAFAEPKSFVRQMESVHEDQRPHDRTMLVAGGALVFLFAFWMQIVIVRPMVNPFYWLLLPGALLAVLLRSCFLRSPRWGSLKLLTIASIVLIGGVQPLLTLGLGSYGGLGYVPAANVQAYIDARRAELVHPPIEGWRPSADDVENDIRAIREAAAAPLWERWRNSFEPSGGLVIFTICALLIAHLLPIAVRRRLRRGRNRMRRV